MRSLKRARERARDCRRKIGGGKEGLLERVINYLEDEHQIELIPANSHFLQNGHALLKPAEGCLYYDRNYDDDPTGRLKVILHELGHLELHGRLKKLCSEPDPVYGSIYAASGAGGLTRYNPRAREEAEANAFATEFLCPQDEAFLLWQGAPDSSFIADHFGVSIHTVHAQLAEALFWVAGGAGPRSGKKRFTGFECDDSQVAAATFTGAPALVCAGPGTGKTATLVRRVEHLLDEIGAEPESLLVLTFSNEAAQELEDRVADRFGEQIAARIRISTFHGFGVSFLHHHGQLAGTDALVLDETGQGELVNSILGKADCEKLLKLKRPSETARRIVEHINYLKNRLLTPESLAAALDQWESGADLNVGADLRVCPGAADPRGPGQTRRSAPTLSVNNSTPGQTEIYATIDKQAARQFLQIFRLYEEEKAARQRVDFADLIALPIRILESERELADRYRKKYRFVLVDEYQDVSRSVATLLRRLCGPQNPPWVVGDARQAIYRFLGASAENVEDFEKDFPDGEVFDLNVNYRSCREIVIVASQLASLMGGSPTVREGAEYNERWHAAQTNPSSFGEPPVRISVANSDLAEQEGVAAQIEDWIKQGVAPGEIAALARRNIDVRNIALALGRLGIKAVAAGLATPEGAAGDLACVATFADRPKTSLPRIAIALGRGRFEKSVVNSVVRWISDTADDEGNFAVRGNGAGDELAAEIRRAWRGLLLYKHGGDAFTKMCAFLFDASDYLRRILALPAGADRSLMLGEITTALSQAAGWRIGRRDMPRGRSRLSFGEYFRDSLNAGAPSLIPPPSTADAVRVMTCHAAKGLEFPYVAVVGQTLSAATRGHKWLPPNFQPSAEEDVRQSDSLFFVGATRAQRALIVSYANTAGGTARSRDRDVTPLLSRWHGAYYVNTVRLPDAAVEREQAEITDIWGGSPKAPLPASSLDRGRCAIQTYLNEFLGARFPLDEKPLYPAFFQAARRAMERVTYESGQKGRVIDRSEAAEIFREEWTANGADGHRHHRIYFALGQKYVERFALASQSLPSADKYLESALGDDTAGLRLRLDLVAFHRAADGSVIAVQFRPESYADKARDGNLQWSKLDNPYRIPFALLRQREPHLRPYVFSGEDGVLYPFLWSAKKGSVEEEARRAEERYRLFSRRIFNQQINRWKCDSCEVHVICPHWLEAA
ncbi:MAG TPA: UvrD-helicase domain-containing protein [Blastocatellia bacterium]|nr:UvrD-helicase domain-containing protein [Blastocatellia bacterium]